MKGDEIIEGQVSELPSLKMSGEHPALQLPAVVIKLHLKH